MKAYKVLLLPNSTRDIGLELTKKLAVYLKQKGCQVYVWDSEIMDFADDLVQQMTGDILDTIDLAIPLGGDGTILSSIRNLYGYEIPILGINLGHVGFLAEVEPERAEEAIDRFMTGDYTIEERILLTGEIEDPSGKKTETFLGLNDAVVNRNLMSPITQIKVCINRHFIESYQGDGLIISTPTGTTAYNLSAGGPILAPQAQNLVITPICPHSLNARSIVTAAEDEVALEIEAGGREVKVKDPVVLTVDGQETYPLEFGCRIRIQRATHKVQMVKFKGSSFYQTLKKKIF